VTDIEINQEIKKTILCNRGGKKWCRMATNNKEKIGEADTQAQRSRAAKYACYQVKSKEFITAG